MDLLAFVIYWIACAVAGLRIGLTYLAHDWSDLKLLVVTVAVWGVVTAPLIGWLLLT